MHINRDLKGSRKGSTEVLAILLYDPPEVSFFCMKVLAKKKVRHIDPKMPKGGSSHGKKKSSGRSWPASIVSQAEYNYFVKEYRGFSFRISSATETPQDTKSDELCIFNEHFKAGLTLPLSPFIVDFCNEGKVLPGMLMPNTVEILNGLYKFFVKWGIGWRLENVLSLLTLTEKNGVFYGQPKHSSEFKIIGIPSSRHGWKNRCIFVKSQESWPVSAGISPPHAQSFKGWGNSEEVVGLKEGNDNKPFCLHVGTLEISPMDPVDTKRKGKGERSSPAKKAKATTGESEEEAKTGSSEEGDEASIQWSEFEEEAPPVDKPAKRKKTGKSPAVPVTPAAEVGEAEGVPVCKDIPGVHAVHGTEIGTEQDIPSPMRRILREESARRPGKEPEEASSPAECYYNSTDNTYYLKQNTKFRYIPDMPSTEVPYSISSIFLHPEDRIKLRTTSLIELGHLQAQMSMGATQIAKYMSEQLYSTEKERRKLHKDNESITAHYVKQKEVAEEHKVRADSMTAQLAEARADFARAIAEKDAELRLLRVQNEAAEEQLQKEKEEGVRKDRINKEIIEGLKGSIAKKAMLSSSQRSKEDIISEYKRSEEYDSTLKEFSEHGYVLLKKFLGKSQLLSKDQLDKIDYNICIADASDEESDNR